MPPKQMASRPRRQSPVASGRPSCKSEGPEDALEAAKQPKAGDMWTSRREALALLATGLTFAQMPFAAAAQDLRRVRVGKAIDSSFPFSGVELGVKQGFW